MLLGPEVIKLYLFPTQLRMKFNLLINVKIPTIVGICHVSGGRDWLYVI